MSDIFPPVISDVISEYKEGSFRIRDNKIILNFTKKEVYSVPLTLKKGIWYYTMSPFVRRYVNFYYFRGIMDRYKNYSLARCYTLIFHHSEFDISQLPRDISISNFSPQSEDAFITNLTFCSQNKIPLLNLAFDKGLSTPQTRIIPAEQMYSNQEGSYLIISMAEIDPEDPTLASILSTESIDSKLNIALTETLKGYVGRRYTYPVPEFDEYQINTAEMKKYGLPTKRLKATYVGDDNVVFVGYDINPITYEKENSQYLNKSLYPIIQKLEDVLSRFRMKNLRHDKDFDTMYRKQLLAYEFHAHHGNYYYNNNPAKENIVYEIF